MTSKCFDFMPRITHFEVYANDTARAKKFYNEIFGWKFDKWDGPMEYWINWPWHD